MGWEKDTEEELIDILRIYDIHERRRIRKIKKRLSITGISSACLISLLFLLFTIKIPLFNEVDQTGPIGAILSPTHGSTTGNNVRVHGKTENIEPGRYVRLVKDKPALELSRPKNNGIKPNCSFIANINENDPEEPYVLSLYTVNQAIHNQLVHWTDKKLSGGFPMLPQNRKLDSVTLRLDS